MQETSRQLRFSDVASICDSYMPDMMRKAYLFEVEGYLADNDERLGAVLEKENGKITTLRVIGGYPVTFF